MIGSEKQMALNKIAHLEACIDRLEKALGEALNYRSEIIDFVIAGEHLEFVTRKQISTMVNGGMLNSDWEIVAKLGIKRCDHLKASQINGELTEPCPDCNGHGWVKE